MSLWMALGLPSCGPGTYQLSGSLCYLPSKIPPMPRRVLEDIPGCCSTAPDWALTLVLLPSVLTPSFLCPGATAQLFFSLKAGRQQSATLLTPILLGKVQKRVICQAPHWEILSGPYSWTNRCDSGSLYEEPTSTMMTTTEGRGGNVNAKTSPKVTV